MWIQVKIILDLPKGDACALGSLVCIPCFPRNSIPTPTVSRQVQIFSLAVRSFFHCADLIDIIDGVMDGFPFYVSILSPPSFIVSI